MVMGLYERIFQEKSNGSWRKLVVGFEGNLGKLLE